MTPEVLNCSAGWPAKLPGCRAALGVVEQFDPWPLSFAAGTRFAEARPSQTSATKCSTIEPSRPLLRAGARERIITIITITVTMTIIITTTTIIVTITTITIAYRERGSPAAPTRMPSPRSTTARRTRLAARVTRRQAPYSITAVIAIVAITATVATIAIIATISRMH